MVYGFYVEDGICIGVGWGVLGEYWFGFCCLGGECFFGVVVECVDVLVFVCFGVVFEVYDVVVVDLYDFGGFELFVEWEIGGEFLVCVGFGDY